MAAAVSTLSAGCAAVPERDAVPPGYADAAHVAEFDQIRFWGDEAPPETDRHAAQARYDRADTAPDLNLLAISGGGQNGAFGAGLLKGWSAEGSRPEFDVVTGVSTGALIAPFAFLGPARDGDLEDAYTRRGAGDIVRRALVRNALRGEGLGDSRPFIELIETYIDARLLEEIAAEHAAGRRLFVITTNLDAGRPVVWNLGAIAAQGGPDALALFRRLLLASSAIPGVFPAVPIEVQTPAGRFTELHADGGVTSNVFAYQPQLDVGRILQEMPDPVDATLFVIRNGSAAPSYAAPRRVWHSVAARGLGVLLHSSAQKDIGRIHSLAERDGIAFRLAVIPSDFDREPQGAFDPDYMQTLFTVGETMASDGFPWRDAPY